MSSITVPTPSDLSIRPRDRRFGREAATPRLWHGGRLEATAIYNALSTTFPVGEAFFVESVRKFREGAPPKLAEEIKAVERKKNKKPSQVPKDAVTSILVSRADGNYMPVTLDATA